MTRHSERGPQRPTHLMDNPFLEALVSQDLNLATNFVGEIVQVV